VTEATIQKLIDYSPKMFHALRVQYLFILASFRCSDIMCLFVLMDSPQWELGNDPFKGCKRQAGKAVAAGASIQS